MNYCSKLSWHRRNIINDSKWQAVSLVHLVLLRSLDRALADSRWNLVWKDSMLYDKVVGLITCKFLTLIVYLKKSFPLFCARQVHFTCFQGQFFPFFFLNQSLPNISLPLNVKRSWNLVPRGSYYLWISSPNLWLIFRLLGFLLYMIALPLYFFCFQSLVRYSLTFYLGYYNSLTSFHSSYLWSPSY